MTHFDLDLTQSHFVKTRGDLTLYASWYGERLRPCLVVLPTFGHAGTAGVPLVVELDSAFRWNPDDPDVSPRASAALVMQFLQANGMDFTNGVTHMRVLSLIHDHLGDLVMMPVKPLQTVIVGDAFRTDTDTGKVIHQEIVKRV